MFRSRSVLVALLALLSTDSSAFAHAGHGTPELAGTFLHYAVEPLHLSAALASVAALVTLLALARARSRRRADETG